MFIRSYIRFFADCILYIKIALAASCRKWIRAHGWRYYKWEKYSGEWFNEAEPGRDAARYRCEKIYKSLREGGIFRIKNIKIYDNIFWVKLNGGDGYFTLYENRVDTISVNHVITVRNGILLHCPVQDDTEYIISD